MALWPTRCALLFWKGGSLEVLGRYASLFVQFLKGLISDLSFRRMAGPSVLEPVARG